MPSTATSRLDGLTTSVAVKAPCRVATTANITLSGLQTVDGVSVVANDRVLVKDQDTASQNGIYVASSTAWERARDFDGNRDAVTGTFVLIVDGTANGGFFYKLTTTGTITIGTTSLTWTAATFTDVAISAWWQSILDETSTAATLAQFGFTPYTIALIQNSSALQVRSTLGLPTTGVDTGVATMSGTQGIYRGSTVVFLSTDGVLRGHNSRVSVTNSTAIVLASSDGGTVISLNSTLGGTITAPSATSTFLPVGFQVAIEQRTTGVYTAAVQSADTLRTYSGRTNLAGQNAMATFLRPSSTSWLFAGNVST